MGGLLFGCRCFFLLMVDRGACSIDGTGFTREAICALLYDTQRSGCVFRSPRTAIVFRCEIVGVKSYRKWWTPEPPRGL